MNRADIKIGRYYIYKDEIDDRIVVRISEKTKPERIIGLRLDGLGHSCQDRIKNGNGWFLDNKQIVREVSKEELILEWL